VSEGTGLPTGVYVCQVAWCQKAQVFPLVSMFVRWPGVGRHRSSYWFLCLSGGLVSEGTGLPTGVYVCHVAWCQKAQVFPLVSMFVRWPGVGRHRSSYWCLCFSGGLVSEGTGLPTGVYVCQVAWCQKAQVFPLVSMFVRWPGVGRHRSSHWCLCLSGGLVSEGTGLPTGAVTGEVRWWNYLYSTLVCAMCLVVSLVGGAMFGKTSVFIFLVRTTAVCCYIYTYCNQSVSQAYLYSTKHYNKHRQKPVNQ